MAFSHPMEPNAPPDDGSLQRVASNAPVGLFETDCMGAISFATARWHEILGVRPEDALGHAWLRAIHDDDRPRLQAAWSAAVEQCRAEEFYAQLADAQPRRRTVRIWLAPIVDAAGRLTGFAGAASDISRFADRAAELVSSRDRFMVVVEAMPQLAWIAAADGTIEYFNGPWLEYTGLTVDRMQHAGIKGVVHPDDLEMTWQRWSNALATGEEYEVEYRLRNSREGTYRWFIARSVPIRDQAGAIEKWIGTATDIDAQVRSNANLRFALDAAGSLSALLDVDAVCNELARLATIRIADWCFVTLAGEGGELKTVSMAHRDPGRIRYLEQFSGRYPVEPDSAIALTIRQNSSLLVSTVDPQRVRESAKDALHLELLESLAMHSAMVVPISTEAGDSYGAVTLVSSESAHSFTQDDVAVVEMVARRAAAAIHTAKVYSEERRRSERLRFIARASELIFESFDLQSTFDRVTGFVVSGIADLAYVMLVENGEVLRTVSAAHRDPGKAQIAHGMRGQRTFRPQAEEQAIRALARERAQLDAVIDRNKLLGAVWEYLAADVRALAPCSSITVPLFSRGETFGALVVYRCSPGQAYQSEDVPLFEDLGRRLSIAIEHAKTLDRERRIAQSLQRTLLPQPGMFPAVPGLAFESEYRPSSSEADVGGDWYDAIKLRDGSIAISVGDVTGRGLRAAGLMGKLRQALGMACLYESDPARLLDSVDFSLRTRGSSEIATAFIGIISPDRKTLRFASAGHPPPLLRRGGDVTELRSTGLPLGLRDMDREQSNEISLEGAQLLILYTDGLTEATRDLTFGDRRLRLVASSQAILYVSSAARFVCDACLPLEAQDDTAVLTVRFGEGPQWWFDAENAQAAHEARTELMAYLRSTARTGDFEAAELVFGELVGNVVRHAPGPIDVQVEWNGEHPVLHVTDRGKGVVRNPSLPNNPLSECGRGLYIISRLTRALRVERIPGYGNHIAAELNLSRTPQTR